MRIQEKFNRDTVGGEPWPGNSHACLNPDRNADAAPHEREEPHPVPGSTPGMGLLFAGNGRMRYPAEAKYC